MEFDFAEALARLADMQTVYSRGLSFVPATGDERPRVDVFRGEEHLSNGWAPGPEDVTAQYTDVAP